MLTRIDTIRKDKKMTNKHTPAPWYYQESNYTEDIIASEITGHTIARCNSYADDGLKANAALIAAAPDIYQALKALRNVKAGEDLQPFYDIADKAISKAEGKA